MSRIRRTIVLVGAAKDADLQALAAQDLAEYSVEVIRANEHDIARFLVHENIWIAVEAAAALEKMECVSLETRDLAKVALRRYKEKYPVQLSGPPFWDHFEAVIRKPLCSKRSSFGP